MSSSTPPPPVAAFRSVPRTGVIYVTTEAQRRGFRPGDPAWCNLGQGQPETGPLPGSPRRMDAVEVHPDDQEYAPVAGFGELREAVASLYNRLFRRGMPSQYVAENVAISGGGRSSLTRAAAALGQINLGHFLPDYTAYEELLDIFRLFSPIPIALDAEGERAYHFTNDDLRREILGRGLSAILMSNPCNPTGKLVSGDDLAAWVATRRDGKIRRGLDAGRQRRQWDGPLHGRFSHLSWNGRLRRRLGKLAPQPAHGAHRPTTSTSEPSKAKSTARTVASMASQTRGAGASATRPQPLHTSTR